MASVFDDSYNENLITDSPGLLSLTIVFSVVLSLLAGFLCAKIAPKLAMRHVVILTIVQLGIGIAAQSGVWELMPLWYHLLFLSLLIPGHLVGGVVGGALRTKSTE